MNRDPLTRPGAQMPSQTRHRRRARLRPSRRRQSAGLDSPGIELAMPADAPVIGPPTPADAGADEAPAHGAPIKGAAPDLVGLTPGVASSVAPRGIPVCPTGAFGMPSGDVMPSAGSGATFMRCA